MTWSGRSQCRLVVWTIVIGVPVESLKPRGDHYKGRDCCEQRQRKVHLSGQLMSMRYGPASTISDRNVQHNKLIELDLSALGSLWALGERDHMRRLLDKADQPRVRGDRGRNMDGRSSVQRPRVDCMVWFRKGNEFRLLSCRAMTPRPTKSRTTARDRRWRTPGPHEG